MDKLTVNKIHSLMRDPAWESLMQVVDEVVVKWSRETVEAGDSYMTLRNLHRREGKIEGLLNFFRDLEQQI